MSRMSAETVEAAEADQPERAARLRRDDAVRVHMPVDVRSMSLTIIAGAVLLGGLWLAQSVIIPLILAGLLFYALDPLIDWLQRWRIPRSLSAAVVLLLAVGGIGASAYALSDDAMAVVQRLPASVRKLRDEIRKPTSGTSAISDMQRTAQAIDQAAADVSTPSATPKGVVRVQIEEPALRTTSYLWAGSVGILTLAGQGLMVFFLTYFLLVADDVFKRKLVKHVGETLTKKRVTVQILDAIGIQIQRFLLVQILTSAIVGVVTAAALWTLGLEQPIIWGLAAGVLNSIPYFGPIIVTIGLSLVGFLQYGTIEMAAAVAGVALTITTLEGWLLTPLLMGRVGSLNQVAIFVSLLVWSFLWNIWGMLLAVPILMVIKAVCDHIEELQPVADFLGDD
jgi:predicted PurR-regulated permease PerM